MSELRIPTKNDHANDLARVKAGVVFLDKDGYALLICQKDNNIWSLPRGSVKVGESVYDGACREMLEESGIDIRNLPVHSIDYFKLNDCDITHYIIKSKLHRKEICVKSEEATGYWWVKTSIFRFMKCQMRQGRVNHPTVMTLRYIYPTMRFMFAKPKKFYKKM